MKINGYTDSDKESIVESISALVNPIFENFVYFMKEMNASHVIRSILSLLTGIPVLAERKGKESKHQHSITLSEPYDSIMCPKQFYIKQECCFQVPEEFHGDSDFYSFIYIHIL